jgi:type VI secretion system secreted protein VgrG
MIKKFFSIIIPLVALLFIIGCDAGLPPDNANGIIKITLNTAATKGTIGITEYEITEAAITLTAPDATEETKTWVTGGETTLIFQNKGTGLYNLSVTESDELGNSTSFDASFTARSGYNVALTIYLGGDISVIIDTDTTPTAVPDGGFSTLDAPDLGSAANYAILAGSTITNAGLTVVDGNIGLYPGITVTGFGPGICNGTIAVYPDPNVATAKLDLAAAYNDLDGRTGGTMVSPELGGTTLTSGVYYSAAGTLAITGSLTLDAQGAANAVFIFQAATTLVTAADSSIILVNGAQAENVYWQIGSSATIGANTMFKGTMIALASITLSTGATIEGRVLTQVAAVSLAANTITSTAAVPTPVVTAEPTPLPTDEPTAEPTPVPTDEPTAEPTPVPTDEPTAEPTPVPTEEPTAEPTPVPTDEPTAEPTPIPTDEPTVEPTPVPTDEPTVEPTPIPTDEPTAIPVTGQAPVDLGSAAHYAILAGSTVTNAGLTVVNGDIGLSPGIAVTGFGPGVVNGTISIYPDPLVATAKLDLTDAYNDAAGRTGPVLISPELGGTTISPGLYNSAAGTFAITGILTLDAQGDADAVFIFQSATTLVTAGDSSIILTNGAQAKNIFWQVGSSATIGSNTIFKGTILAMASITVSSGVTIDGRALTQVAAVSLDTNTITVPTL